MKKIATLTFHRSDNFGSVLQAYALQRVLLGMGYGSVIIDYRKDEVEKLYRILKDPVTKYDLITDCYNLCHYSALKKRQERFEEFRKDHLITSNLTYHTENELISDPPSADVYICGSDQIWNPCIPDFDCSYLLNFVKNGKKISYAASGISPAIADCEIAKMIPYLSGFSEISVREKIAAEKLEQLLHKKVDIVLDPTLLLMENDWDNICGNPMETSNYMLCYFAGGVSKEFEHYTKNLASKLNYRRIILMPEWRNWFRSGTKCYNSGPSEFVTLIRNAGIICTNSFHGTAFSVIFNKPFIVGMCKPHEDARINTLLEELHLTNREIDVTTNQLIDVLAVEFTYANARLEELRKSSINWLRNSIEGVTKN